MMRPDRVVDARGWLTVLGRAVVPTVIPLVGVLFAGWSGALVALLILVEGVVATVAVVVALLYTRREYSVDRLTGAVKLVGFYGLVGFLGWIVLLIIVITTSGNEPPPPVGFWVSVASILVTNAATLQSIRRDTAAAANDGTVTRLLRAGAVPAIGSFVFAMLSIPAAESQQSVTPAVVPILLFMLVLSGYFEWYETVHRTSGASAESTS